MNQTNVIFAFLLTLIAGLSTGIGSLMVLLTRKTNNRILSLSLGFSAGFMIYVSMIELFQEARHSLVLAMGNDLGEWATILSFFGGMLLIAVIDRLVPSVENPHEARHIEDVQGNGVPPACRSERLMRVGFMSALAIAIHNFPEGIATFATALHNPRVGAVIALAVAIHNIPEGIAVSIPIYCATGSRRKAFYLSFLSGLSEPVGALLGFLLLFAFLNDLTLGVVNAMVAGIMVFISLDELLPTAREYGSPHYSVYGLIGGMFMMAVSLKLLT